MKNKLFSLVTISITIIVIVLTSCKSESTPVSPESEKIAQEIDRICDSIMTNTSLPGLVVGIWSKEKGIDYVRGKGFGNLTTMESINPEYHFRIGSNTKSFVVTTAMQLAAENKLSLEDKLSKYFPDFPDGNKVTLRMLCNMTSGINNYTDTEAFEYELGNNPLKQWTPQEHIDLIMDNVYKFEPGSDFSYSNTNTSLLGMIIEQITDKSLEENFKERFINKYGLTNTTFPSGNKISTPYIHGYANYTDTSSFTDDVSESFDISWAWAAGAMVSNLQNTRKWVEMLIDGDLLPDTLQQQRFTGKSFAGGRTYGMGIFTNGDNLWGHNGGLPGYTSIMMRHRTLDFTIVIFCNWQWKEVTPDDIYKRLVKVVYPDI